MVSFCFCCCSFTEDSDSSFIICSQCVSCLLGNIKNFLVTCSCTEFSMSPGVSFFLTLTALWTSALIGCPQHGTFAPESSALESLECRNDYRSHIHCSWRHDPQIPLSLIHMDPDDHRVSPCVQSRTHKPSQNPTGQERVCCRYNTSLFAIGFDDVFFFHTPHSSGISKTFRLTTFDADPHWNFEQLDDTPPPSRLTSDPFRLHEQERSEVETNHKIVKDQKGEKIHTKSTQKDMEDSKNKTEVGEVLFEGQELISEYALPGPSNLHCVLNGGKNVSCSWDLKTDLTRYIIYTISYRTHSTAPAEWYCVEKVQVTNEGGFLRTVGAFSIFEPGVLQVRLTPTPVTKVIRSYQHIQPACPTGLSVELRGEDWILNWTLTKYRTVPLTTELKYWSILTPEDVKSIFLSDGEMVFAISESSLKGSSEYQAQVRCNVSSTRRSGWRYTGYPSEWTDPVYWTTQPEPLAPNLVAFLLYFLIATLASAVSIVVFIILVVLQRKLREWDASLPSPVHSKVSEVSQHPQMDHLPCCTELKDPEISNAQIVDVRPQFSSLNSENTLTSNGNNLYRETDGDRVVLHVDDPCLQCSGNVMGIDGTYQPNFHDLVLPCSEGYLPNPATSVSTTQKAWQEDCSLNVEMDDGYMNCPEPDLNRSTNPHFFHTQDLNTNVCHEPSPGSSPERILVVYYSANIERH
ncbi:cytokine receptor common subunit beta-like isoform X3 [Pimephales promelas]|uniref:cytokine receptor common subunit beta-like isoform X3 n=1 Tax=Pimephales promelas TaxID=90988 RepID=UPI001955CAE6|nr:cytokine receptor common subunit beta-like isoform X3 [Pimephales promelas]